MHVCVCECTIANSRMHAHMRTRTQTLRHTLWSKRCILYLRFLYYATFSFSYGNSIMQFSRIFNILIFFSDLLTVRRKRLCLLKPDRPSPKPPQTSNVGLVTTILTAEYLGAWQILGNLEIAAVLRDYVASTPQREQIGLFLSTWLGISK